MNKVQRERCRLVLKDLAELNPAFFNHQRFADGSRRSFTGRIADQFPEHWRWSDEDDPYPMLKDQPDSDWPEERFGGWNYVKAAAVDVADFLGLTNEQAYELVRADSGNTELADIRIRFAAMVAEGQ